MISVEDLLRFGDVFLDAALLAPGQAQQHVEIVAHHGRLSAHRLHAFELFQLLVRFLFCVLGQLGLFDLFDQLGDLITALAIATAQLALNRFQLLVEIIFALRFLHLTLHTPTDLTLNLKHGKLAFHEGHDEFQPFKRAALGKQRLLVRNLGADRRGDCVGQLAGVVDFGEVRAAFVVVLAHLLVELGVFGKLLDHLPHQGGDFAARHRFGLKHADISQHVAAFEF